MLVGIGKFQVNSDKVQVALDTVKARRNYNIEQS